MKIFEHIQTGLGKFEVFDRNEFSGIGSKHYRVITDFILD